MGCSSAKLISPKENIEKKNRFDFTQDDLEENVLQSDGLVLPRQTKEANLSSRKFKDVGLCKTGQLFPVLKPSTAKNQDVKLNWNKVSFFLFVFFGGRNF